MRNRGSLTKSPGRIYSGDLACLDERYYLNRIQLCNTQFLLSHDPASSRQIHQILASQQLVWNSPFWRNFALYQGTSRGCYVLPSWGFDFPPHRIL